MQKTTIKECSDSILEIMRSKNYSESSMYNYRKIFTDFTIYCDNIGVKFFDMNVAIEYVNSITGLELTELAHDGKNTKKYIVLLRAMRLLSNYSINKLFILRFYRFVDEIENAVNNDLEVDMIEIDVKRLWETLGEITGEVGSDDLLNEIFSKFCLGK